MNKTGVHFVCYWKESGWIFFRRCTGNFRVFSSKLPGLRKPLVWSPPRARPSYPGSTHSGLVTMHYLQKGIISRVVTDRDEHGFRCPSPAMLCRPINSGFSPVFPDSGSTVTLYVTGCTTDDGLRSTLPAPLPSYLVRGSIQEVGR